MHYVQESFCKMGVAFHFFSQVPTLVVKVSRKSIHTITNCICVWHRNLENMCRIIVCVV